MLMISLDKKQVVRWCFQIATLWQSKMAGEQHSGVITTSVYHLIHFIQTTKKSVGGYLFILILLFK